MSFLTSSLVDIFRAAKKPDKRSDGRTALHEAAAGSSYRSALRLLTKKGADANARDSRGSTPLHEAAADYAMLRLLLRHGADPAPAFHEILALGCERSALLFLMHGADANLSNRRGETPLHWAVLSHGCGFVKQLILLGARVNGTSPNGETALHWLLRHHPRDWSVLRKVRLLLFYGASVNAIDRCDRTPLYDAVVSSRSITMIEYLVERGANVDGHGEARPIVEAVYNGDFEATMCLIESGARVADVVVGEAARSLLQLAIERFAEDERLKVAESLVASGADVDYARDSETPLQLAIRAQDFALFSFLLGRSSVRRQHDGSRESPLVTAINCNFYDAATVLLGLGHSTSECDDDGRDLLSIAVWNDDARMIDILLDSSGDRASLVDAALMNAVKFKNRDVLRRMLDLGADVNRRDAAGRLPLHVAVNTYSFDLVKWSEDEESTIYSLLKHIALLKFCGRRIDDENDRLISSDKEAADYCENYRDELERMRSKEICRVTGTTYLDVLARRRGALLERLRYKSVACKLASVHRKNLFTEFFPHYWEDLRRNYLRGLERLAWVDDFSEQLYTILDERLPVEVIVRICEFIMD